MFTKSKCLGFIFPEENILRRDKMGARVYSLTEREIVHKPVKSVDRAISVMEYLADAKKESNIGEVSQSLGFPKSSVHRILSTLTQRGYVEQNLRTREYRLSLKVVQLGREVLEKIDLISLAHPFLRTLMHRTNENVDLAATDGREVIIVDEIENPDRPRVYSQVGLRRPLHCSAMGKVVLASHSEEELEVILRGGLKRFTSKTNTLTVVLRRQLRDIRSQGFAIEDEEYEEGIRGVAAPIVNREGRVIGVVGISAPLVRMSQERITELARYVKEAASSISVSLGYRSLH
jgi:DNA-binding IclR family transcriptional regulator